MENLTNLNVDVETRTKKRKKSKSLKPKALLEVFDAYIEHCTIKQRFVNVAGFCVFANISRQTFYNYRKNEDYEIAMDYIDNVMEDETLNVHYKQYPMAILYLKNKFGYSDKVESRNVNTNIEQIVAGIAH